MAFDLVAFDCDGVLVDTEPVVNRVFVQLVAETGGPTLDETATLARFTGVTTDGRVETVVRESGWTPPLDFDAVFAERHDDALRAELRLVPGVEAVVRRITGPHCVVSNGTCREITIKLELTGLLALFDPHLFSAMDLPRQKPFPDIYLHAASKMGVAPARAAAVEDSGPGVRAAVAAGFTVFGYASNGNSAALQALGARPFTKMADLPALLGLGS